MEDDLTGEVFPGDRVVLNGILRSSQRGRFRQRSTLFDIFSDIVSVEMEKVEYEQIQITPEDAKRIEEEAASGDVIRKIVGSIAPSVYGLEVEKEAMALQLFGGVPKELPDGRRIRGDSHILLVGDPGTAKSELLTYMVKLSPRGIYASGKAASSAGLTAAAVRDEFGEGRWTLEAGALVLGDKGLVALDEVEKMNEVDRSSIHTAMEQQAVHVAKAGITATLQTRCSILAAANPTLGRFDDKKFISEQINLPPTLLSVDYHEPILVREDGEIRSVFIGELVDSYYREDDGGVPVSSGGHLEVPAFDPKTYKIQWSPVRYLFRHRINEPLYKLTLETGRTIRLTRGHSVYVYEGGQVRTKPTSDLKPGDYVVIPNRLPPNSTDLTTEINLSQELAQLPKEQTRTIYLHDVPPSAFDRILQGIPPKRRYWLKRRMLPLSLAHLLTADELRECILLNKGGGKPVRSFVPVNDQLMRLLGYYIAEGSMTISSSKSYMISLSFNQKETDFVEDVRSCFLHLFGTKPRTGPDKNSTKVVLSNKVVYLFLRAILGIRKGARNKEIPRIVLNAPPRLQREFLKGYFRGDRGVTVSRNLISDTLYVLLQSGIIGHIHRAKPQKVRFPDGHETVTSGYYLLFSPSPYRERTLPHRRRLHLLPYRETRPLLGQLLSKDFQGWYGKQYRDPRMAPNIYRDLLGRKRVRERLRRLEMLESPLTTDKAAVLFETTAHREHARAYLQRLFRNGFVERERIHGGQRGYSWRYRYRLSTRGRELLAGIRRLERLMDGDLAYVRVRSITRTAPSSRYVYDLSIPGGENFVAGLGGVVCHNSRFDVIFPIMDRPQAQFDKAMAEHILKGHLVGEQVRRAGETLGGPEEIDEAFLPYFEPSFLRKYVAYAKRLYPVMSEQAMGILQEKYLEIRRQGEVEGGAVPITPRQLEAFIRLAEASARARLSPEVTEEDANRAVRIVEYWLQKVTGIEGRFDIDIVATGVSSSQRTQMIALRDIIAELSERDGVADLKDIIEAAEERAIPPSRVDAWLKRWSQEGEVYSPAANKWKLVSRF